MTERTTSTRGSTDVAVMLHVNSTSRTDARVRRGTGEFRRNYAEVHPQFGLPWSSKALRECYQVGAERFGWSRRNPEVASMRDGHWQVGTAWPASPTVGGRSAAKPGRPCAATEPQWFAAPPATSAPGATR